MKFRSVLFVPCANAKAMARAATLACDALIFDLEDAVGEEEKEGALKRLIATLSSQSFVAPYLMVRVDLGALSEQLSVLKPFFTKGALKAVVFPKSGTQIFEDTQGLIPGTTDIWAMIESAHGLVAIEAICEKSFLYPLKGLIAGPNDLRKDLSTRPMAGRADILYALSQIVVYARAYGLVALDGVYNQFRDETGFAAECQQGRSLGFDGKTLIHPAQIVACEAAFSPSEAEVAWAKAVVTAFEGSAAGVVSVKGEMVERLHLEQARIILR